MRATTMSGERCVGHIANSNTCVFLVGLVDLRISAHCLPVSNVALSSKDFLLTLYELFCLTHPSESEYGWLVSRMRERISVKERFS